MSFSDGVAMRETVSMGLVPAEAPAPPKEELFKPKKILVTGCLGFIASTFVKQLVFEPICEGLQVVGVSRNSDQKNLKRLQAMVENPESFSNFKLVFQDLNDANFNELLEDVDVVVNFAAKTFVDYSVRDVKPFFDSNVQGTYNLLEAVRKNPSVKLFVQISTDEVYGALPEGADGWKEDAPLNPTNPYSATKAASDMLCVGYMHTYKLPILITRTENNYGFFQHPQKVIPTWVKRALANQPLQIYGDGKQKRMWLRVEDHVDALIHLIQRKVTGIVHIAGGQELENIDLAKAILGSLEKPESLIEYVDDSKIRPNHDRRYGLNTDRLKSLGWTPKWDMMAGISNAVCWYSQNQWWMI